MMSILHYDIQWTIYRKSSAWLYHSEYCMYAQTMLVHYQVKYMKQGDCRCSREAESWSKCQVLIGVVVYTCVADLYY